MPESQKRKLERAALRENKNAARTALLVLGMHRSGTSALGGVLALLGSSPPKTLIGANEHNARGYWESAVINDFHESVLSSAGTDWQDWTPFNRHWLESPIAASYLEELQRLIAAEYGDSRFFFVKDPRMCKLFELWRAALEGMEIRIKVLIPIRDPAEVASSLAKRDGMSVKWALLTWLRHVLDAEWHTRDVPRAFSSYNGLLSDWRTEVARIASTLELKWPRYSEQSQTEIESFLSGELRHHEAKAIASGSPVIDAWVKHVYESVLKLERSPSSSENLFAELDRTHKEFDQSVSVYGSLAFEQRVRALSFQRELQELDVEYKRLQQENQLNYDMGSRNEQKSVKLREELEAANQRLTVSEKRVGEEQDRNAQRLDAQRQAYETTAHELQAQIELLQTQGAEARRQAHEETQGLKLQVANLRAEVGERDAQLQTLTSENELTEQLLISETEHLKSESANWINEITLLTRLLIQVEDQAQSDAELLNDSARELADQVKRMTAELEELKLTNNEMSRNLQREQVRQEAFRTELGIVGGVIAEQNALRTQLSSSIGMRIAAKFSGQRFRSRPEPPDRQSSVEILKSCHLFDAKWYLRQNEDVQRAGVEPASHYFDHGAVEGRDPGPVFSTNRYLRAYPDVAAAQINPLIHYIVYGRDEGREAVPDSVGNSE